MRKLPLILFITIIIFSSFFKLVIVPTFAQEEQEETEKEIIIPEQSLFCTDFPIYLEHESTSTETIPLPDNPNILGTNTFEGPGEITGTIELGDIKQPDFFLMNERLTSTLPKLLPLQLNEKVDVDVVVDDDDEKKLKSWEKHFVSGADDSITTTDQEENYIPDTKFTFPGWWTELLGRTKIFCGLLNACEAPKSLAIKVEQPDLDLLSSDLDNEKDSPCEQKNLVLAQKPEIETINKEFKTTSILKIIEEIIETIIGNFKEIFTRTRKTTTLENKSRGYLVGGKTLVAQSALFSSFIPHDINSLIKKTALNGPSSYLIKVDGYENVEAGENSQINSFQEEQQVRGRYCLQICSLYPPDQKFDIRTIDPICISCDPKDYQF
jgi:hypothetical protein